MGIFTKKEKTKYIQPEAYPKAPKDRASIAAAAMPGAMERLGRAGETYPGELTAGMSEYEEYGLGMLGDYLKSPMTKDYFKLAGGELEKTLGGDEYDPIKGPYAQAFRNAMMKEIAEAKDRLASRTSARDKFFGGGRIKGEADIEESAMGDLSLVLGQLYENERQNRLNAVTQAGQLATLEETLPQMRIGASQTFGALPRELEQQGLDAQYQEWQRALGDLGIPLDVATGLSTWQPNLSIYQTGGGKNVLGELAPIIGAIIGGSIAGPAGASAGAAAGGYASSR